MIRAVRGAGIRFIDIGGIVVHHCLNFHFQDGLFQFHQKCNLLSLWYSYRIYFRCVNQLLTEFKKIYQTQIWMK